MKEKNRDKINACQVSVDKRESTSAPGKVEIFCKDELSESHVMAKKI